MPPKNPLAENVRRLRTALVWTQAHLAEAARITERTVQRLESGGPVAAETLQAIAGAFDVDVRELTEPRVNEWSPEEVQKLEGLKKRYSFVPLEVVERASQFEVSQGSHGMMWNTVPLETHEQEDAAARLHESMTDVMDIANEVGPVNRLEAFRGMLQDVEALRNLGLVVAIGTHETRLKAVKEGDAPTRFSFLVVLLSKVSDPKTVAMLDKTKPLSF